MKKKLFLPILAILALTVISCSNDDDDAPQLQAKVTSVDYYGVITVGHFSDTVRCTVVYDNVANEAEIIVNGMQFSDKMPAIDMCIPGILCTAVSSDILFDVQGEIVPEVSVSAAAGESGAPNPAYAMSGLSGAVSGNTMEFSARMAMGDLSFEGNVVQLFTGGMDVVATGSTQEFVVEDVICELEQNCDGKSVNLYINGARFAEGMPATVDIKLEGLACEYSQDGYNISSSATVVPFVSMAGSAFIPMPAFSFSSLNGKVLDAGSLHFVASMTRGNFSYNGQRFTKIVNQ